MFGQNRLRFVQHVCDDHAGHGALLWAPRIPYARHTPSPSPYDNRISRDRGGNELNHLSTTTLSTDGNGIRDRWELYHLARTFVSLGALACLFVGAPSSTK